MEIPLASKNLSLYAPLCFLGGIIHFMCKYAFFGIFIFEAESIYWVRIGLLFSFFEKRENFVLAFHGELKA